MKSILFIFALIGICMALSEEKQTMNPSVYPILPSSMMNPLIRRKQNAEPEEMMLEDFDDTEASNPELIPIDDDEDEEEENQIQDPSDLSNYYVKRYIVYPRDHYRYNDYHHHHHRRPRHYEHRRHRHNYYYPRRWNHYNRRHHHHRHHHNHRPYKLYYKRYYSDI